MKPRLLYLDVEGTGTDPQFDRIVEFCFHDPEGETWTLRVNPGCPIPAEATAVHGISDADVVDSPRFATVASRIQALITGRVLVGYNLRKYDSLILDAELQRAAQPGLLRDGEGRIVHPELDLFTLWQREEPRSLATAALRFGNTSLEDAHSAEADTLVLPAVLAGMIDEFILDGLTIEELCARCVPDGAVDRDGKFRRREDGVVLYNFGDKRGRPVAEDPGLAQWMLRKDFSDETKAVARQLLEEIYAAEYAANAAAEEQYQAELARQGVLPFVLLLSLVLGG